MRLDEEIARNLAAVRARVAGAAQRSGRDPATVRVVAVSKTFGPDHVRAAVAAGQRDFGENRVQEALAKIRETSDLPIRWHLVGHLQSNKVRKAVSAFACIHSIDDGRLLAAVDRAAADEGVVPEVLVQVDLAGEATKHGAPPDDLRRIFDVAASCRAARVTGLMVLPPLAGNPEETRPYFRRLREIGQELRREGIPTDMLRELSMGMSHDVEAAVEEGATMVRVGTAIFGRRHV